MKIEISFIRNGNTELSQNNRFVGSLDAPLSSEGVTEIKNRNNGHVYPVVSRVYSAASRRCRETTTLIYGGIPALIAYNMHSLDMGAFGGMSYDELRRTSEFIKWVSSHHVEMIPGGGSPYKSMTQNISSFKKIVKDLESVKISSASIITEGMAIQMIFGRFAYPRSGYFNPHIPHGGGCTAICDSTSGLFQVIKIF